MSENLFLIQQEYLKQAWSRPPGELEAALPGQYEGGCFHFQAFGEPCELHLQEIILGGERLTGPEGVLIALYASQVPNEQVVLRPLKAFKQFRGSMGYQGAFVMNAQNILLPHIPAIQQHQQELLDRFSGHFNPDSPRCDLSFTLYPLPRVALYYMFNLADEEFAASAICLFPSNATNFMPVAGLADVAEYTARRIIQIVTEVRS